MKNVELSAILTTTVSREIFWYQKYYQLAFSTPENGRPVYNAISLNTKQI